MPFKSSVPTLMLENVCTLLISLVCTLHIRVLYTKNLHFILLSSENILKTRCICLRAKNKDNKKINNLELHFFLYSSGQK